jgi:hypothetical protein
MSDTTGAKDPIENVEADVFGALDRYFEARLREVASNPKGVGDAVEIYEAARRQLAEAEEELEGIRHRTEELKASTMEAVVGSSDAGELGEEISEVQEELRDLTQAEESAQRRKEDAEKTLRRVGGGFRGGPRAGRRRGSRPCAEQGRGDRRFQGPTGPAFRGGEDVYSGGRSLMSRLGI